MSIQSNNFNKDKADQAVNDALETIKESAKDTDITEEEAQEVVTKTTALMGNQFKGNKKAQEAVNKLLKEKRPESIHQARPYYDERIEKENKQKIKEAYDSFDESEKDPMKLAQHLMQYGIHAHITTNYYRKAKHGIARNDDAHLVLAFYHNPVPVTVGENKILLDGFVEELITPKSWKPEEEEVSEPVKKSGMKSIFSRKKK